MYIHRWEKTCAATLCKMRKYLVVIRLAQGVNWLSKFAISIAANCRGSRELLFMHYLWVIIYVGSSGRCETETACLKVTRVGNWKKYERLTSLPDGAWFMSITRTDRQAERQTNRQTDKQINRLIDRLRDRQCEMPLNCVNWNAFSILLTWITIIEKTKHNNLPYRCISMLHWYAVNTHAYKFRYIIVVGRSTKSMHKV